VLVPLVERDEGWFVVLTLRSADLADHAGQISLPGGRIEPEDDDARAAALREAE
jgi:8-oxo-dGTP pyrophosphatase MutT (NUDIX family)